MFWDKIAGLYDLFENIYNKNVYNGTGKKVAEFINLEDTVLECACGTGAITIYIADVCKQCIATDFSLNMLKQAKKKLSEKSNVKFEQADITKLNYPDESFDVAVAGNVIHLLPNPQDALKELERVCKPGGKLIIPTYINDSKGTNKLAVKFLEVLGASFKRQFDEESYKEFFKTHGYENVQYEIVKGKMACELAIIERK